MKHRPKPQPQRTYSLLQELAASPTEPLCATVRTHQLTLMWQGLAAMEKAPKPTTHDWRVVSDAVNLMETLVEMGVLQDQHGLLTDAITSMAEAGKRFTKGGAPRLSGPGMLAVRGILEDYAHALTVLPARTMVRAHRKTEIRIADILANRRRAHDVEIVAV